MQVGHSIAEDTAAARGCCLLRDPRGWLRPRVHRGFWLAYHLRVISMYPDRKYWLD